MMKHILVMGGAGYIGSHCVRHLLDCGYMVTVADNLSYGHRQAVDKRAHFILADLMNVSSLEKVFLNQNIDAVIHFAAFTYVGESVTDPQKYYVNNVVGTINLLSVMLKHNVKKIVFSSTCATYGTPQYMPLDEAHRVSPINPYGQTKLVIENIFADYKKAYGLEYIALRYFNAAGASFDGAIGESHNPETHLIPLVLKAITGEKENITIFGNDYDTEDGTCIRDYIHVEDLATAHQLALTKLDTFSGAINLGTGQGASVLSIIRAAENISGKKCPVVFGPRREGDPASLYANNTLAKKILGWEIKYTDIKEIIKTAYRWETNKKF